MTAQERKIRIALLQAQAQAERQLLLHQAQQAKASILLPASVRPYFARKGGKPSMVQTLLRLVPVFAFTKRYPYLTRGVFSLGQAMKTSTGGTTWRLVAIGVLGWQLVRRLRPSERAASPTGQARPTTRLPAESSADPS